MRKRPKKRLSPGVYLDFFTICAKKVRAAGFEPLSAGGIFTRQEMDRMDEWCERGEKAEDFADWLIVKRAEEASRELAMSDLNMGDETISPKDVAA